MSAALTINLVLLCIALVGPRMTNSLDTAAVLFAVPMALILAIGAWAAIRAYILARREGRRPRWTAFLPLSVFLVGILATVALVNSDFAWKSDPVEVKPGKH